MELFRSRSSSTDNTRSGGFGGVPKMPSPKSLPKHQQQYVGAYSPASSPLREERTPIKEDLSSPSAKPTAARSILPNTPQSPTGHGTAGGQGSPGLAHGSPMAAASPVGSFSGDGVLDDEYSLPTPPSPQQTGAAPLPGMATALPEIVESAPATPQPVSPSQDPVATLAPRQAQQLGPDASLVRTSQRAANVDLGKQSWFRTSWSTLQATRYLECSPKGSFVIRGAPEASTDYVLSVQAGPRVAHVLLRSATTGGRFYWRLHANSAWFEHIFDLVLYCSVEPFCFKALDPHASIKLNLLAAEKAEEINRKAMIQQHSQNLREIQRQLREQETGLAVGGKGDEAQDVGQTSLSEKEKMFTAKWLARQQEMQSRILGCERRLKALQAMCGDGPHALTPRLGQALKEKIQETAEIIEEAVRANAAERDAIAENSAKIIRVLGDAAQLGMDIARLRDERMLLVAQAAGQVAQANALVQTGKMLDEGLASQLLDSIAKARSLGEEQALCRDERHQCLKQVVDLLAPRKDPTELRKMERGVAEGERVLGATIARLAYQSHAFVDVEARIKAEQAALPHAEAADNQQDIVERGIRQDAQEAVQDVRDAALKSAQTLEDLTAQISGIRATGGTDIVGAKKLARIDSAIAKLSAKNDAVLDSTDAKGRLLDEATDLGQQLASAREARKAALEFAIDQLARDKEAIAIGAGVVNGEVERIEAHLDELDRRAAEHNMKRTQRGERLAAIAAQLKKAPGAVLPNVDTAAVEKQVASAIKTFKSTRRSLAQEALRLFGEAAALGSQLRGDDDDESDDDDENDEDNTEWIAPIAQLLSGKDDLSVDLGTLQQAIVHAERVVETNKQRLAARKEKGPRAKAADDSDSEDDAEESDDGLSDNEEGGVVGGVTAALTTEAEAAEASAMAAMYTYDVEPVQEQEPQPFDDGEEDEEDNELQGDEDSAIQNNSTPNAYDVDIDMDVAQELQADADTLEDLENDLDAISDDLQSAMDNTDE
eukprot:m.124990 g.124990  ORF g.124990 m.124990 type:complete len:1001 (+) comp16640_c2_seq1:98-3100(+)